MLWLARKAFFGHVPFPALHVDTGRKLPEMIKFRDQVAKNWGIDLIIDGNPGVATPEDGRIECCTALKTGALKQALTSRGFTGVIAGIRRDEEGTRAKERVFSPRGEAAEWNFRDQPPEFWDQYNAEVPPGSTLRIHPLLDWTEIDVWRYIQREEIPVVELYFSREGKRYRSLGCAPCTHPIDSEAADVAAVIAELASTNVSERSGRAQDRESEDAFERLRASGYM